MHWRTTVQRSGNRLRVNVQLIDAETSSHLWAERFDKPVTDLFDMQDEIVARLAGQLGTQLITAEARRGEKAPHPELNGLLFSRYGGASATTKTRRSRGSLLDADQGSRSNAD